jgi:hypothetical protein
MKKKKFSTTIDIVFSNADINKKSKYSLEFNCLNKIKPFEDYIQKINNNYY